MRARISIESIENNAAKILLPDKVMIGVPETLRRRRVTLPKKQLSFHEPIPTSRYALAV
ncbi:MAG: hypothetical protein WAZ77_10010 [Candidatus Nitrosopolaris sp.]